MFYFLHTPSLFTDPFIALFPSHQEGCQLDPRKPPSKEYYQENGIKIRKLKWQ